MGLLLLLTGSMKQNRPGNRIWTQRVQDLLILKPNDLTRFISFGRLFSLGKSFALITQHITQEESHTVYLTFPRSLMARNVFSLYGANCENLDVNEKKKAKKEKLLMSVSYESSCDMVVNKNRRLVRNVLGGRGLQGCPLTAMKEIEVKCAVGEGGGSAV